MRYAYGDNEVYGIACVAKAHGGDLEGELLTVAEEYDSVAWSRFPEDKGTVTRDTAAEMWREALDNIRSRMQRERNEDHAEYLRRALNEGEAIAEKV